MTAMQQFVGVSVTNPVLAYVREVNMEQLRISQSSYVLIMRLVLEPINRMEGVRFMHPMGEVTANDLSL